MVWLVPDVDRFADFRVLEEASKGVEVVADAHEVVEVVGAAGGVLEERAALAEVAVEQYVEYLEGAEVVAGVDFVHRARTRLCERLELVLVEQTDAIQLRRVLRQHLRPFGVVVSWGRMNSVF